ILENSVENESNIRAFLNTVFYEIPEETFKFIFIPEIYPLFRKRLDEVLSTLSEKEKRTVELRFGLGDGTRRTYEEIGDHFGVTRERIRQIFAKAGRKMRHPIRIRQLNEFLKEPPSLFI